AMTAVYANFLPDCAVKLICSQSRCTSTRSLPVDRPLSVRSGGGCWSSGLYSVTASANVPAGAAADDADAAAGWAAGDAGGAAIETVGAGLSADVPPPQPTTPAAKTSPAKPQHVERVTILGSSRM